MSNLFKHWKPFFRQYFIYWQEPVFDPFVFHKPQCTIPLFCLLFQNSYFFLVSYLSAYCTPLLDMSSRGFLLYVRHTFRFWAIPVQFLLASESGLWLPHWLGGNQRVHCLKEVKKRFLHEHRLWIAVVTCYQAKKKGLILHALSNLHTINKKRWTTNNNL